MAEYIKTLTNKARTDSIYPRTLATAVEMNDRESTLEEEITSLWDTKLDKSLTKQLSTEDYTSAEKNKLMQIPITAEENQFAFSYIQKGTDTPIAANAKKATVKLEAGPNITILTNPTTNTITLAATGEIGTTADSTSIADLGNYYISTNVEDALQEVGYSLSNLTSAASGVTLEDVGEYYPVHNVEDALQQIGSSLNTLNTDKLNKSAYVALGDILYASDISTPIALSGNTTTTKKYLTQTGDGSISAAPVWSELVLPSGLTAGSTSTGFLNYNGTTAATGQLYGGTTNPSNTTRLNYDGYLYATKLYSGANEVITAAGGTLNGTLLFANASSPNTQTIQFGDNSGWNFRMMTNVSGTPTVRYTFSDQGNFTAVGNITAYSDERLKTNIQTIPNALEKVQQLRGVSFDKDGKHSIGVIAQEIQKIIPEVVLEGEYLSVAYGNIVGLLIEAIKEQQNQINELKTLIGK